MPVSDSPSPPDREPLGFAAAGALLSTLFGSEMPPSEPANPDQITGYTLDAPLGRGAGGAVYRAYRPGSDQPLAIKILHRPPGVSPDSRQAQRAWRELQVLSDLRLPCLPRVVDYGSHPRGLYIVTEFVDGLHLDRFCEQRALERRQRVELLARVADCVQMLHERGVIHRDLKPSNILIDSHGQPFIIDLGLAAVLAEGLDPTHTLTIDGTPLGTPAFMAPEQARGERVAAPAPARSEAIAGRIDSLHAAPAPPFPLGVTTRSDVYGLGATAYVVLTRHTPHDMNASLHEAVRRVAQDPPRDPRTLDATLPRALAAVLTKACADRAANRYASASEFGNDLRRWLRGEPVEAGTRSLLHSAFRWSARRPRTSAVLLGCLTAAALVSTSLGYASYLRSRPAQTVVNSDANFASLLAADGSVVKTWTGKTISLATIVLSPPGADGAGRVLLCGDMFEDNRLSRRLSIFSALNLEELVWQAPSQPPKIQAPGFEDDHAAVFYAHTASVEEIFADNPGPEIVTVHRHTLLGRSAIAIYSLAGEQLARYWHRGRINSIVWLPRYRLLLAAAPNNNSGDGTPPFGLAIMALKPQRTIDAWIWPDCPAPALDDHITKVAPEWYGLCMPRELWGLFEGIEIYTERGIDNERVRAILTYGRPTDPQQASLALQIDPSGALITPPIPNAAAVARLCAVPHPISTDAISFDLQDTSCPIEASK